TGRREMVRVRRWLLLGCFLAGFGVALVVLRLDANVRAYLAGPPLGGARLYSAPSVLRVGEPVPGGSLVRKLTRLGYRQAPAQGGELAPGEFRVEGARTEFAQRPSPIPWAEPERRVRATVRAGRVTALDDLERGQIDHVELEPETLAVIGG